MHPLQGFVKRKYHILNSTKGHEFYGNFNHLTNALYNPTTLTDKNNSKRVQNYQGSKRYFHLIFVQKMTKLKYKNASFSQRNKLHCIFPIHLLRS